MLYKTKNFFKKNQIPLLEWYFPGATFYFCVTVLNFNMLITCIVMGFVNKYVARPVINTLADMAGDGRANILNTTNVFLEILKAFVISSIIMGIYYVINTYLFSIQLDGVTFATLYWLISYTAVLVKKRT